MGDAHSSNFSFDFNRSIRVEARDSNLSADAGVLILREIEERLGLVGTLAGRLTDPRNGEGITHPLTELLRTRLFALAQGYTDQDDLDFLRNDPAFRLAVSERRGTAPLDPAPENAEASVPDGLSSQPTQSRLVENLSKFGNLAVMNTVLFDWAVAGFREQGLSGPVVLDVDSFPIEVFGSQPGSAYNGYYEIRCFHPIITMLAGTADILSAELRPGNAHTAHGVLEHLRPVFERAKQDFGGVAALRGDAGFPEDKLLSFLETERVVPYVFRIKTNAVLDRLAQPFLHRPPGRRPNKERVWFHELSYRAEEWSRDRRIVLVILDKPGELYLDRFFLVTNWSPAEMGGEALLDFYRQRGSMERHLGEIKSVLCPTLSSSPRPKKTFKGRPPKKSRTVPRDGAGANAATFLLYALAFNLMNIARNLLAEVQPDDDPVPSLGKIRSHVLETATRVTRTARRATFIINESCRHLWRLLLDRVACISPQTPAPSPTCLPVPLDT